MNTEEGHKVNDSSLWDDFLFNMNTGITHTSGASHSEGLERSAHTTHPLEAFRRCGAAEALCVICTLCFNVCPSH